MAAGSRRGSKPVPFSYRAEVAARLIVGLAGGYALTAWAAMLLARLLPMSRLEATETAILLSFLIYAGLLMTVFAVRRLSVLLIGLTVAGLALAASVWLTHPVAVS